MKHHIRITNIMSCYFYVLYKYPKPYFSPPSISSTWGLGHTTLCHAPINYELLRSQEVTENSERSYIINNSTVGSTTVSEGVWCGG